MNTLTKIAIIFFFAFAVIYIIAYNLNKEPKEDPTKPLVTQIDSLKQELNTKDEIINKLRNMPTLTDKQQDSIIAEYESRFD